MKRPPSIVVQLVHIFGPFKGQIQEFTCEVISVGRHPSCSLHFAPDLVSVSRRHADISRDGNVFKLVDHSTNGTLVNGKKVKEVLLKDGDIIEFSSGGPKVSFLTKVVEPADSEEVVPPPSERPLPVHRETAPERPASDMRPEAAPPEKAVAAEPAMGPPKGAPVAQRVTVPLIIQFGPTIRTFKELPIIIGRSKSCEFFVDLPDIADQHAQILFSQGRYWVKDLTGLNMISLNQRPIELLAPLNPQDVLSLTPQGPFFQFIGEGRLAEVARPSPEKPLFAEGRSGEGGGAAAERQPEGIWSILKKKS